MFQRASRKNKVLSIFLAVMLILTCNSATFQPMALAFADSLAEASAEPESEAEDSSAKEPLETESTVKGDVPALDADAAQQEGEAQEDTQP